MSQIPADVVVLADFLREYNEHPEQRAHVVAQIEARFRKRLAILVIDGAGFTRIVGQYGIVVFLARLELLARLIVPLIERFEGKLLKREADNFFAVFPGAQQAIASAAAIRDHVGAANEALPADEELHVSLGVGHGDLLLVGSHDVFGDEMNLACKLGEDLAQRGELLITPSAYAQLGDEQSDFEAISFSVSGLSVQAHRLLTP